MRHVQEVRAGGGPRQDAAVALSLRALLLAGAYPLIPPDKIPKGVNPGSVYGEYTPVTLLQGVGETVGSAALQLGTAVYKGAAQLGKALVGALSDGMSSAAAADSDSSAPAVARTTSQDSSGRSGSAAPAAPSPGAAAPGASAAAKPRRMPPPPPPKMP